MTHAHLDLAAAGEADGETAWLVHVTLSNGKVFGADLVISAIGVKPNVDWLPDDVRRDEEDGGVLVDR